MKKCDLIHGEVICVFRWRKKTTIENLSFHISHVSILGSMECGKTQNDFHDIASNIYINLKKDYAEIFNKTNGKEIQGQHWGRNL